jgi:DNA repair protein RecN (Recombination protein N)
MRASIPRVLRLLHIAGLGVINELDIEPAAGLTVLTGETGAGKTMITVGVSLALGARASAQLVRAGEQRATVQARFDAPAGAEEWAEDGEVILARAVSADGRGSARLGGQLTTSAALAEMGARLVEIHGQHGSLRLLDGATQTAFLDRFAGPEQTRAVASYRSAYERLLEYRRQHDALLEAGRDRERMLDLLAYQVREIEGVAPGEGESDALTGEEARLSHAERLQDLAEHASATIGDEGGASDLVASAADAVASIAALDPDADTFAARSDAIAAELRDLASELRSYRERVAVEPERLSVVRERIAALKGLQRKYGASDADVLTFLERARRDLDALRTADDRLSAVEGELGRAQRAVEELGARLHTARARAAPELSDALTDHLEELGMPGAAIQVGVTTSVEPGPLGLDRVELRFKPGASQPVLPLSKAASGGELSRVMLICRSVLADLDDVPTLVFDEIDAGIGGEAGLAVGRRLARLAVTRQVLVVTHLPQIACFADLHVRVRKDGGEATAQPLDDHGRVAELSRMLAGMGSSRHASSHAEELLGEAARVRASVA